MELERLTIDRSGSRGRRRRRNPWIARVVALAVLLALAWLFREPILAAYERATLPEVRTVKAVPISAQQATALSGTAANGYVVAATRAALSADTPGRVVQLEVTEGSVVREGDLVARLFADEYEAAVKRAQADVELASRGAERAEADVNSAQSQVGRAAADVRAAQAQLSAAQADETLAMAEWKRANELLAEGFGTQQDVDRTLSTRERATATVTAEKSRVESALAAKESAELARDAAKAALEEARARVPLAEASLEQARATLSKTEVRAPFDGVVVLKDAEVGEVVSPNSQGGNSRGSVVTMVDFDSLEVQIDLPETSLSKVEVGQKASIFLDAFSTERLAGEVSRIWPTANRQKASVEVRVRFEERDERLRPEMGARVVFEAEEADTSAANSDDVGAILVRESAFRGSGKERTVFVVEDDRVRAVRVEVEEATSGRLRVLSGLEGGETLVAEVPARLEDGARVRVADR
ncbi:MAG: efflux RND transporter periplasmic adaptor subunit [Planctomycetota bacterium]